MKIIQAHLPAHYEAAIRLIKAYMSFLGEDLTFQHIEEEYELLPIMYGKSVGALLLCEADDGQFAGMVAVRKFDKGETTDGTTCEMKRLYVLPTYSGLGMGKKLCVEIIEQAKQLGYKRMVLDTLERLQPALRMYLQLGFVEIPAYYQNPLPGVVYMEKILT